MDATWDAGLPGVLLLPSGRRLRGLSLRTDPEPRPDFALALAGSPPPRRAWTTRWVRWRDFGLPADRLDAHRAIRDAYERCASERVLVGCGGGVGRTGTVLACLAVLDGVPAEDAVGFVRRHYHRRAVETWWQERYVRGFRTKE